MMDTRRTPALDRTGLRTTAFATETHQPTSSFADIRAEHAFMRPRAGNIQDNYRAGLLGGLQSPTA